MFLIDTIDHFISGDWGEETLTAESPKATYCVRGADINNVNAHSFYGTPLRYVARSSFDNKQLQAGDIVIEKSGGSPTQSTGRTAFISQQCIDELQDVVCSNFCAAFRVKENWNSKYVFYYMQHVYNSGVFFNFEGKTSGLRNLQIENAFKSIPIEHIDKPIQDRIVHMLDKIESLIVLKNAINRNLEQVAHQLYDYWFIQFDFPNHEGKPYKSSGGEMVWNEALKRCIPIGWKDCFISDVEADIVTGKTPSTSDETNFGEDIPFVTIDDIRGHYFVFETSRNLSLKGADAQSSKYLPKGSLFCSCIGTPGVIGFAGTKVQTNQQINSIRFKHKSNAVFLYYGIKLYFSYANAKIGNILPNMSKGEFEKILIVYPGETIIRKFDDLISPVFNEIEINSQSIISLLKMRDELLPMLLNGQVNCDLSQ